MARGLRMGLVLTLLLGAGGWQARIAAQDAGTAVDLVPADAILVLEVAKPGELLDFLTGPRMTKLITSLPAYKRQENQPGYQGFVQIVRFLEAHLNTSWRSGLHSLLDGGITLAVLPGESSLLIIDAKDGAMMRELNTVLLAGARDDAVKVGRPDPTSERQAHGTTVWSMDGKEAHAILGDRLVMANPASGLERVLAAEGRKLEKSLSEVESYRKAKAAAGDGVVATGYANMEVMKMVPGIAQALKGSGNPMNALLFSGFTEALNASKWLSLALRVEGETLSLSAATDGQADPKSMRTVFMTPPTAEKGALPNLKVPGQIAGLSVYRDLYAFYAAKDSLFPERTSELIFFENMMGIFFSGRDLTEEVFGEAHPEVRLVVAEQQYDPKVGTPRVKVPAFALVIRAKNPDAFSAVAEEAWQKAVGLVTVTRGQSALPGMIIDRQDHKNVRFSLATNSMGEQEDRASLPMRYNYRPALARVGEFIILSSTDGLVRDLIDAITGSGGGSEKPLEGVHSLAELDGLKLAKALDENRATLVSQNMVEKGNTRQQSESEIDGLITIARLLGQMTFSSSNRGGNLHAELNTKLNLP